MCSDPEYEPRLRQVRLPLDVVRVPEHHVFLPDHVGLHSPGLDPRRNEALHQRIEIGAVLEPEREVVEPDAVLAEPIVARCSLEGWHDHEEGRPDLGREQRPFGRGSLPDRGDVAGHGDLHEVQANHVLVEAPSSLRVMAPKCHMMHSRDLHPVSPDNSAAAPSRNVRRRLASSIDADKSPTSSRARASCAVLSSRGPTPASSAWARQARPGVPKRSARWTAISSASRAPAPSPNRARARPRASAAAATTSCHSAARAASSTGPTRSSAREGSPESTYRSANAIGPWAPHRKA